MITNNKVGCSQDSLLLGKIPEKTIHWMNQGAVRLNVPDRMINSDLEVEMDTIISFFDQDNKNLTDIIKLRKILPVGYHKVIL